MISRCIALIDQPLSTKRVRQVVEQLGMRGPFAELAEVARRAHDAVAEMMLPDAVHHHARGERIVRVGDRFGQFQPAASVVNVLGSPCERIAEETRWRVVSRGCSRRRECAHALA